jgi:hypothetical protein
MSIPKFVMKCKFRAHSLIPKKNEVRSLSSDGIRLNSQKGVQGVIAQTNKEGN